MRGADFLQLNPAAAPSRGMTTWLTDELRGAIHDGRLGPGTMLPASRILAGELGVSRGVVVQVYQRLNDEGMVSARPGLGTVVTWAPDRQAVPPPSPGGGLSYLPRRWRAQAEFDLSPGVPDLSGFPRAAWLRAERTVFDQADVADLGYGDPRGCEPLRRELASWLARTRGLRAGPDEIIVVNGVAQAIALLARWLHLHGQDGIAVEDPGSRGAIEELAYWGLRPVPVEVDDAGLRASQLTRSPAVRAVMVTPAHQFPTGVVLAPGRRRELLAWAEAADGLIIEDDYDAEYRYDRTPVPAMHASDPRHVAYAGSTSKTLAPGLRLGWLIPPARMRADLLDAKHASDLGSPALPQLVLAQLIASGDLERHVRLMRKRQRGRRDALLAALRLHLPRARVRGVAAGLHLLVTFPGVDLPDTEIAARLLRAGVLVHPLSAHGPRCEIPGVVLGYAAHTADQLREAVRRLGSVINGSAPLSVSDLCMVVLCCRSARTIGSGLARP